MSNFRYTQEYVLQADAGVQLVLNMQNDTDFQFVDEKGKVHKTITVDASISNTAVTKNITVQSNSSAYASSYIVTTFAANSFGDTSSQCNLCFNLTNPGGDSYWSITGTSSQGDNQSMFPDTKTAGTTNIVEVQISTTKNPPVNPSQAPVLDPNMVFLLDKSEDVLFFRGNAPLGAYDKKTNPLQLIDFSLFQQALQQAYKKATGEEMPAHNYELDIVALLGSSGNILGPEYQSLGGQYDKVENTQNWYPALKDEPNTIGSLEYTTRICQWNINPAGSSDGHYVTMIEQLAENLNTWFTTGLTDGTGQKEANPPAKRIIYMHCSSGHDRTGMAATTYIAKKKLLGDSFVGGSTSFKVADLAQSYLLGTTLNHIPYTGGHYKQTVYNYKGADKLPNANKSRCFLISTDYDNTVCWVINKMVNPSTPFSWTLEGALPAISGDNNYPSETGKEAYVENYYVWDLATEVVENY